MMLRDGYAANTVSRLIVGVTALVFGVFVALTSMLLWPPLRPQALTANTESQQTYQRGDIVDVPPFLYANAPQTLLLFVRSTCGACEASRDVLGGLVEQLTSSGRVTARMITAEQLSDAERAFGRALGLAEEQVHHLDPHSLRLTHVPTVALVDRNGRILWAQTGALSASDVERFVAEGAE